MEIRNAIIEEVIKVTAIKGNGTEKDPARQITQYWTKDGILIAEIDPLRMED